MLSGLLGVVATLCGILLVLYLVRCGRQAGRSHGKSRTSVHGTFGVLTGIVVLLASLLGLGLGFVHCCSVHHFLGWDLYPLYITLLLCFAEKSHAKKVDDAGTSSEA